MSPLFANFFLFRILPQKLDNITLEDIDPLELARQMTLMEAKLYSLLSYDDFMSGGWYVFFPRFFYIFFSLN